jgi:hypothetical protein
MANAGFKHVDDRGTALGVGGAMMAAMAIFASALMAFVAVAYDGWPERPALEVVPAAVPATGPPASAPTSFPSGQPRIVAYIVGSEEVARELSAGLEHLQQESYHSGVSVSVVVAETPDEVAAWKLSLDMAGWEGIEVMVHDLTTGVTGP